MSEIVNTNKYSIYRKYKTVGTGSPVPMDEYKVVLFEENSEDCGYIPPQYRWDLVPGQFLCDYETYTKYQMLVKMVSYDSGETWSQVRPTVTQRGSVIAYDSYDCGKPMYRWVGTDDFVCIDNEDDFKIALVDISGNVVSGVSCSTGGTLTSGDVRSISGYSYTASSTSYGLYQIGDCIDEVSDYTFSSNYIMFVTKIGEYVTSIGSYAFRKCGIGVFSQDSSKLGVVKLPRNLRYVGDYPFGGQYDTGGTRNKYIQFQTEEPPECTGGNGSSANTNTEIKTALVPYGSYRKYYNKFYLGIPQSALFQEPVLTEQEVFKFNVKISGNTYYFGEDGTNTIIREDLDAALRTINYHLGAYSSSYLGAEIEVGDQVESIGSYAFTGNSYNITRIIFTSQNPPTLANKAFGDTTGSGGSELVVPCAYVDNYLADPQWQVYSQRITTDCDESSQ
jgi:hypothetical protein